MIKEAKPPPAEPKPPRPSSAASSSTTASVVAAAITSKSAAADKRRLRYELEARERERKEEVRAKAAAAAAAAAADPVGALMDATLNFGDEEVSEAHHEVLVGWTLVPETNAGTVSFQGLPTEVGHYRIRYFVHGSHCALPPIIDVHARLVRTELRTPRLVYVGDPVMVRYKMHYEQGEHGQQDWAGLYVVPHRGAGGKHSGGDEGSDSDDDLEWTPYDYTHPIEVAKLPPGNEGVIEFTNHPVYPGMYEVRVFIHQDVDLCVGVSPIITAHHPYVHFSEYAPLQRELRIYLSASSTGSKDERQALHQSAMPLIRRLCEERCISPAMVDVRSFLDDFVKTRLADAVATPSAKAAAAAATAKAGRRARIGGGFAAGGAPRSPSSRGRGSKGPIRLGDVVETMLQELEDCRPMVLMVMGQGYGLVPQHVPAGVERHFPWLRHHHNPALPKTKVSQRNKSSMLSAMRSLAQAQGNTGNAVAAATKRAEDAPPPDNAMTEVCSAVLDCALLVLTADLWLVYSCCSAPETRERFDDGVGNDVSAAAARAGGCYGARDCGAATAQPHLHTPSLAARKRWQHSPQLHPRPATIGEGRGVGAGPLAQRVCQARLPVPQRLHQHERARGLGGGRCHRRR